MAFFSMEMVIGGFFILAGAVLKIFPPRSRNLYGYRTPLSLKSERNWKEGNKLSAKLFILGGCLNILIDFMLLMSMPSKIAIRVLVSLLLMIISSIYIIVTTEKRLKEIDRINE
jgi:uncharacterized membrane protein